MERLDPNISARPVDGEALSRRYRISSFSLTRILAFSTVLTYARGQLFPAQFELSTLNGQNGFTALGSQATDNSGYAVSNVGDINADNTPDFAIGAHTAGTGNHGQTSVIFGGSSLFPSGTVDLGTLGATNGFTINGVQATDVSGYSVSGRCDLNADGTPDIVIGAKGAGSDGAIYVVFGKSGLGGSGIFNLADLNGTNGFIINPDNHQIGEEVSCGPDVNGDNIDDLMVAAPFASLPSGRDQAGKIYVVFGKSNIGSNGAFNLSGLNGSNGFVVNGAASEDWSGSAIAIVPSVNGDSFADLVIGAPQPGVGSGKAYVVFGKIGLGMSGVIELSGLNGSNGFTIVGDKASGWMGNAVASALDINADGKNDLVVGAHNADPAAGRDKAGITYVIFGKMGLGSSGTFQVSSLNGSNGFAINGNEKGDNCGHHLWAANDVNDDDVADLIVGARGATPAPGREKAGKVYVIFGQSGIGSGGAFEVSSLNGANGFSILGEVADDQLGSALSSGDLNNDNLSDLFIGANRASPDAGRTGAGKTYVIYGRSPNPPTTPAPSPAPTPQPSPEPSPKSTSQSSPAATSASPTSASMILQSTTHRQTSSIQRSPPSIIPSSTTLISVTSTSTLSSSASSLLMTAGTSLAVSQSPGSSSSGRAATTTASSSPPPSTASSSDSALPNTSASAMSQPTTSVYAQDTESASSEWRLPVGIAMGVVLSAGIGVGVLCWQRRKVEKVVYGEAPPLEQGNNDDVELERRPRDDLPPY